MFCQFVGIKRGKFTQGTVDFEPVTDSNRWYHGNCFWLPNNKQLFGSMFGDVTSSLLHPFQTDCTTKTPQATVSAFSDNGNCQVSSAVNSLVSICEIQNSVFAEDTALGFFEDFSVSQTGHRRFLTNPYMQTIQSYSTVTVPAVETESLNTITANKRSSIMKLH